jgi:hypothetical protein
MSQEACDALDVASVIDSVEVAFDPGGVPLATVVLSRVELDVHCTGGVGDALAEFVDVPVGDYTADAQAFRSDAILIGAGTEAFAVVHGELTEVTITLSPVTAQGDLIVDLDIDGDWSALEGSGG